MSGRIQRCGKPARRYAACGRKIGKMDEGRGIRDELGIETSEKFLS